jgi:nucleoside-diphosphate-sugar epimerase
LAAQASVARSWEDPAAATLETNLRLSLNLLEAVRAHASEAHVLVAGSGEVYGPPAGLPVDEEAPLRPQSPYAVSKRAVELLARFYADAHGLHVVCTRSC